MKTYSCKFHSYGNIDFGQCPRQPQSPELIVFGSIEQIQSAQREYVYMWDLGGGNWPNPAVFDADLKKVGYISYNGKFWPSKEKKQVL